MASSKEFKDFILCQLQDLQNVVCKPMMGEYLLYCNNKLFGGIYDNASKNIDIVVADEAVI